MAGMGEMDDVNETLRSVAGQARDVWDRFAQEVELERRLRESPMTVLGVAAAAGFVIGGGLWPVLRPFVKAAAKAAMSPANLLAVGAAVGALRATASHDEMAPEPSGGETH